MARSLRLHVETTGNALPGWDKQETAKPTTFMMMTKCAAVMVLNVGPQRQLPQPLSPVQQPYLLALGVPATSLTAPRSGERDEDGKSTEALSLVYAGGTG
jgi:hypothetical protein